jgi:UDP:flavonoid glycosyltransferase YjiC (YdhE family)
MRIAIIAAGSRGDVRPDIALGKELAGAGNGVRLLRGPLVSRNALNKGLRHISGT